MHDQTSFGECIIYYTHTGEDDMFASYNQQEEDEGSLFANKDSLFSGSGALFNDIAEEEGEREPEPESRQADLESSIASTRSVLGSKFKCSYKFSFLCKLGRSPKPQLDPTLVMLKKEFQLMIRTLRWFEPGPSDC